MKYSYALLASVLVLPAEAGALENEPVDFRGISWGAAYADYAEELTLVRTDDDVLVYVRETEKAQPDRYNYQKIAYRFYKDRFSVGIIQTFGQDAKKRLRQRLTSAHGDAVRISRRQELDAWNGENVQIVLSCSVTSYCVAEFISRKMIALEEKETGVPVQVLKKNPD